MNEIKRVITEKIRADNFRVLFWNSVHGKDEEEYKTFPNGAFVMPAIVPKQSLSQFMAIVTPKITMSCATMPHLAFENIPAAWISPRSTTKVYFVTDGEIGYGDCPVKELVSLREKLAKSIQTLCKAHPLVQLHILTVEPQTRDFTQVENLQRAAGCDVFNACMEHRLTAHIARFTSFSPKYPDGFVHIKRAVAPPGFVPFGDRYFSELKMRDFVIFLSREIAKNEKDENALLEIAQNVVGTLCRLTKDKPARIAAAQTRMFCGLFQDTVLNPVVVNMLLGEAVEQEQKGQAEVFAVYRSRLSKLYKLADQMLKHSVRDAVGIQSRFVTFALTDKIFVGDGRMVTRSTADHNPQACVDIDGMLLPAFPLGLDHLSDMNEQCLRQWTRYVMSKLYCVHATSDAAIHHFLALVLRVVVTEGVPPAVAKAYQNLGLLMLRKKRLNQDKTELDHLLSGELPTASDQLSVSQFLDGLRRVSRDLFSAREVGGKVEDGKEVKIGKVEDGKEVKLIKAQDGAGILQVGKVEDGKVKMVEPMTVWYLICTALGNETLVDRQWAHCRAAVNQDLGGASWITWARSRVRPIELVKDLPDTCVLDYSQCLITLEDTSKTGGMRIRAHASPAARSTCSPVHVLSQAGFEQLTKRAETSLCPLCYAQLDAARDFEKVPPETKLEPFFSKSDLEQHNLFAVSPAARSVSAAEGKLGSKIGEQKSKKEKEGERIMVVMRGVVGAGKSTWAREFKQQVERLGYQCFIEGMDKYTKLGERRDAAKMVERALFSARANLSVKKIVVIDTCGERHNPRSVFNVDFCDWKTLKVTPNYDARDLQGYLAWSLRNVLTRPEPSADDHFVLNPHGSSFDVCVRVHAKKATALFGGKAKIPKHPTSKTADEEVKYLTPSADAYAKTLVSVQKAVSDFIQAHVCPVDPATEPTHNSESKVESEPAHRVGAPAAAAAAAAAVAAAMVAPVVSPSPRVSHTPIQ